MKDLEMYALAEISREVGPLYFEKNEYATPLEVCDIMNECAEKFLESYNLATEEKGDFADFWNMLHDFCDKLCTELNGGRRYFSPSYTTREVESIQELTLQLYEPLYDRYSDAWGGVAGVEEKIRGFVKEFEDYYVENSEEYTNKNNGMGFLDCIAYFCDKKLQEYGLKPNREQDKTSKEEKSEDTPDKSFYLVTDMVVNIANELDDEFFKNLQDTRWGSSCERNEFYCDVAQEILSTWDRNDWADVVAKGVALAKKRYMEILKEEMLKNAKFKVGDKVLYLNVTIEDDEVEKISFRDGNVYCSLKWSGWEVNQDWLFATKDDCKKFVATL